MTLFADSIAVFISSPFTDAGISLTLFAGVVFSSDSIFSSFGSVPKNSSILEMVDESILFFCLSTIHSAFARASILSTSTSLALLPVDSPLSLFDIRSNSFSDLLSMLSYFAPNRVLRAVFVFTESNESARSPIFMTYASGVFDFSAEGIFLSSIAFPLSSKVFPLIPESTTVATIFFCFSDVSPEFLSDSLSISVDVTVVLSLSSSFSIVFPPSMSVSSSFSEDFGGLFSISLLFSFESDGFSSFFNETSLFSLLISVSVSSFLVIFSSFLIFVCSFSVSFVSFLVSFSIVVLTGSSDFDLSSLFSPESTGSLIVLLSSFSVVLVTDTSSFGSVVLDLSADSCLSLLSTCTGTSFSCFTTVAVLNDFSFESFFLSMTSDFFLLALLSSLMILSALFLDPIFIRSYEGLSLLFTAIYEASSAESRIFPLLPT